MKGFVLFRGELYQEIWQDLAVQSFGSDNDDIKLLHLKEPPDGASWHGWCGEKILQQNGFYDQVKQLSKKVVTKVLGGKYEREVVTLDRG